MNEALKQRLLSINPNKPYIWQLKLTKEDFLQLGSYVRCVPSKITKEYAILAIEYIAEWYKREYEGNVSNPLEGISAETLWKESGFSSNVYVYHGKKTLRHLESIFMLGGLPMRFILKRNDQNLLKTLCKLYKGDKSCIEDNTTVGKNQAIAFQESINQQASIFKFMEALLVNHEQNVFAEEDLTDKSSLANQFINAVKQAYDEVMRDKFQLEWLIDYNPASPYMKRMLRVHLRPEEIGGNNQYLRFDRAATWHIPNLMQQRRLRVHVLFRNGTSVIEDKSKNIPIITFENTGQEDTGFEATGDVPWGILRDIPNERFDSIDVVITDDSGKRFVVQKFKSDAEYMQLWKVPDEFYRWSNKRSSQKSTAVVFSDFFSLTGADSTTKPFYNKSYGISAPWHFAFIEDHVCLKHTGMPDIMLWNREGYIQFSPKLYTDVLQYQNGKVCYLYNEDPDIYPEPESEEWYPALFCREDVRAYHFNTREMINTSPDKVDIQKIEFKAFKSSSSTPFEEWTEYNQPPFGRIKLRLTIKDDEKIYPVLFLPSLLQFGYDYPIIRDCHEHILKYVDNSGQQIEKSIAIPQDFSPLPATVNIVPFGNEEEKVVLNVVQPTLIKEIYLDGKISKYLQDGEKFILPYLLYDRVEIHDFNLKGYNEFKCFNVGEMEERGSLDKWICGDTLRTTRLTTNMPDFLEVRFGNTLSEGNSEKMIYWDYSSDSSPKQVDSNFKSQMGDYSILFQDMREVRNDFLCIPPVTHNDQPMGFGDFGDWEAFMNPTSSDDKNDDKPLCCFDMAVKYKTYFFIFNPLFNLSEEDFVKEICHPLLARSGGKLNETDISNLMRCASELGFKWENVQNKI